MVDLALLQTFRVLHDQGTVTAAAGALNLSPSAVSHQLRQLSRQAGAELLEPDGRRVRLTAAGRALLRHADVLCAQWEEARAEVARQGGSGQRTVRFGGLATSIAPLLAPVAEELRAASPPTHATVAETDTAPGYRDLLADRLDIALVTPVPDSPRADDTRFHQELLLDDVLDLVVPPGHRIAEYDAVDLAEAAHEDWVAPHSDQRRLTDALCTAAGFTPRTVHQTDYWHAALALVAHGLGVCLVPRLVDFGAFPRLVQVPVRGTPPPARRILACARKGSERQDAIADGLSRLRSQAAALVNSR
ncbi:LysR family transcriptional regulator [Streptomyces sp. A7024]|uniref:LysR family transcriptional regulator n=1 Tax=Streptomyces coryli TaxID=1128680 RepID=A0A6G4U2Q6_9ACTN|nr:LysR family transcriptional regulator [Streptomyces coryli]NGN66030.1 LysR family transcriptional regulator [Streptomyces coryli]